ncbi:MAG: NAD(P)H-binding protein [Actinomycetes bacterium]|jgi:putative NADH-flavin reductase|nr:MAG: NAD-dependent epimerase [Actinomycetota bacterium]
MKILVLGGTGYAGANIVAEAARRGHQVVAFSRSAPANPVDGVEYAQADVHVSLPDLSGADVVVAALSPRGDNAGKLRPLYLELGKKAAEAGARFVVIGGFSSMRPAPGAPRIVEGDIPEIYAAEAREMHSILEVLAAGEVDADWVFVSPAGKFGSFNPGTERGTYRVSSDGVALFDETGESDISGADFARAVVDEIENPAHHRAHIHFAY